MGVPWGGSMRHDICGNVPLEMWKACTPASTRMGAMYFVSSMSRPPGVNSSPDSLMTMGKSRPALACMFFSTSRWILSRDSIEPP